MQNTNTNLVYIILTILLPVVSTTVAAEPLKAHSLTKPIKVKPFQPPSEVSMPDGQFVEMVKLGKKVFTQTNQFAGKYVGNGLSCSNCHLGAGSLANSAPLWAAWVHYPAYRGKNDMVNTMEQRIQGCFRYSMNGTPPPGDSDELKAIMSYSYWMASGAPTNTELPGRGYPKIDQPNKEVDYQRGKKVFAENCSLCHGENGQGTKTHDGYAFPPLWGEHSFNWGAGMHRIKTAARFIRANMPYGKGGSLSEQQAWDVAYFVNSHERPQDPRFEGNLAATDQDFHDHKCRYGDKVDGHVLGRK
jgi:thiosulfate dehydrogenase